MLIDCVWNKLYLLTMNMEKIFNNLLMHVSAGANTNAYTHTELVLHHSFKGYFKCCF